MTEERLNNLTVGKAVQLQRLLEARGQLSLVSDLCHPGIYFGFNRSHQFLLKKVKI